MSLVRKLVYSKIKIAPYLSTSHCSDSNSQKVSCCPATSCTFMSVVQIVQMLVYSKFLHNYSKLRNHSVPAGGFQWKSFIYKPWRGLLIPEAIEILWQSICNFREQKTRSNWLIRLRHLKFWFGRRETRLSPRQMLSKTIFRMPEKLNCSIKKMAKVCLTLHVNFMSTLIRTSTENASILRIANI